MPVTLELGGKSPNIVFEDADFEAAVMGAISVFLPPPVRPVLPGHGFWSSAVSMINSWNVLSRWPGRPRLATDVDRHACWAGNNTPQYRKNSGYIAIAKSEGAKCVLGGGPYQGLVRKDSNLSSQHFHWRFE